MPPPGDFPKDINRYQTGKTMDNVYYAVKKGGVVIILSECSDICEPQEFSRWLKFDDRLAMEKALRQDFPGWVALKEVECSNQATYILVTWTENTGFLAKTSMISATSIEEALQIAREKCGTETPTYI
ncbi:MAG: hypothetical protein ACRDBM_06430 [Sporomusa sp.]